jgi:hypothetical protein
MDPITRAVLLMLSILPLAPAQPVSIVAGAATDSQCQQITYPATGWTLKYTDANLPAPYTSLCFGPTLHYRIPLPSGVYVGWLTFVEPSKTAVGQRLQTVSIQGQVSAPIDVFGLATGQDKPYKFLFVAIVSTGILDIQIVSQVGSYAVLSGIDAAGVPITSADGMLQSGTLVVITPLVEPPAAM